MAAITLNTKNLKHNYQFLHKLFKKHDIEWGIVTKLLCGNRTYLKEVLQLEVAEIHDSRLSNLKTIKELRPDVQTVYIKPPPLGIAEKIVRYADVSFNTELSTMKRLSEEAVKQGKQHKVIIMIEMGDLREGVMGEDLVDFYDKVFQLDNIEVIGLGTNLNCLHGVMPSTDKLIQLSLYRQLIEAKFNRKIEWISGGSSVTIPLLMKHQLPKGINHLRIGEALFFGLDLFTNETIAGMVDDIFTLEAEIIELNEKPLIPVGEMGLNPQGEQYQVDQSLVGRTTHRAILDVGVLDINPQYLIPVEEGIEILGASSDMIVVDLGENERSCKVGDQVKFKLRYMGALSLLSSRYIDKKVV